jgi:hypothetical protein
MKIGTIFLALLTLAATAARAEQQTRLYGPDGQHRHRRSARRRQRPLLRRARERLGTSTTTGNTTRFYDAGGKPTGSFQFDGRMRRPVIPGTAR